MRKIINMVLLSAMFFTSSNSGLYEKTYFNKKWDKKYEFKKPEKSNSIYKHKYKYF